MAVEFVNRSQFVRSAGLHPAPSYSRIICLSLFTTGGGVNTDSQESAVLGSSGVIHRIEVHAHPAQAQQRMDAVVSFGIGLISDPLSDGPVAFKQRVMWNYGGSDNALIVQSTDDYFDLRMRVRFIGDKTRLGAVAKSDSGFGIRFQLLFQISEG